MAESKNTFLQGKMNKDLDDRIIANGEYRDALNISVGKSEGHNVGSLQNVLGNKKLTKPSQAGTVPFETIKDLVCIGYFVDNENNRVFQLLTNYIDPNPSLNTLPTDPDTQKMKITVYDPKNTGTPYLTLAEGIFLNFSTTNLVTGINLIEDLLFWTDNRNQPRKINVATAIANSVESGNPYYTTVDQISVAKYAPFPAPTLYYSIQGEDLVSRDDEDSTLLAGQVKVYIQTTKVVAYNLTTGCQLINADLGISASDSAIITNIVNEGYWSAVYISGDFTIPQDTPLVFYKSTMTNESDNPDFIGDSNFLRDKFIRFSYRFRFDDNEYSLMSPFTQPVFIPKQKGFFIEGNEDAAYRSTIVEWMENEINSATLFIELPDTGNNLEKSYKIESIDILYKESDALTTKVVETININKIKQDSPDTNIYSYKYNSQKPYKTLQPSETTRVYDKVPIKALAQEVAGNRVIYGNFVNQSTPPSSLDYNVAVFEKDETYSSWIEYPNHTVKQNRTYQVGVVLADKFGRESSVILSNGGSEESLSIFAYGASSVYLPYKPSDQGSTVKDWLGYSLNVIFNSPIASNIDEAAGTPGLYATVSGVNPSSFNGFEITAFTNPSENNYTFELVPASTQYNYPIEGKYLRGKYKDYVEVLAHNLVGTTLTITTDGPINAIYEYNAENTPDIKYSYLLNELGWYSYKIVVKQQEQDYYNVYIPGMLAGYPVNQTFKTSGDFSTFPVGESYVTSHFVSINDNINKVPRDLTEVGPNQKQYRSSAQLWPRVENVLISDESYTTNRQYYPSKIPDVVNTIAPAPDLGFLPNDPIINPNGSAAYNLYQFETSPLICRISTNYMTGVIGNNEGPNTAIPPDASNAMSPFLGVYETAPTVSLLDIFYETSTTGLISDLNVDILTGSEAIFDYSPLGWLFYENQDPEGEGDTTGAENSPYVTNWFAFQNSAGTEISNITSCVFSAKTFGGVDVTSYFELVRDLEPSSGTYLLYRIKITTRDLYYGITYAADGSYFFTFQITHTVGLNTYNVTIDTLPEVLQISNVVPEITFPEEDEFPIYQLTTDPITGPVVDMSGRNGNTGDFSTSYLPDLYWSYDPLPEAPDEYNVYFSVNPSSGDVSIADPTNLMAGTYNLGIKLQDSTTSEGVEVGNSLSTNRTVSLSIPDVSVGCSNWTSSAVKPPGAVNFTITTSGYIDIWKMARKNEAIASSTVRIFSWTQAVTNTTFPLLDIPANRITFNVGGVGSFKGVFSNVFLGTTADPYDAGAAQSIRIKGKVYFTGGRTIDVDYSIDGIEGLSPGYYYAETCTTGGYVPTVCKAWYIHNTSPFPIPFSGLHGNGKEIVGGIIEPDAWAGDTLGLIAAGNPINQTVYPVIRDQSLQAATNGITGGEITYVAGFVSCPT